MAVVAVVRVSGWAGGKGGRWGGGGWYVLESRDLFPLNQLRKQQGIENNKQG